MAEEAVEERSYLDDAIYLTEASKVRPGVIRARLRNVFIVFAIAFVVAGSALIAIFTATAESPQEQLLASFVLAGALTTMFVSLGGGVVALWSAYVVQYIRRVAAQEEVMESTGQTRALLTALEQLSKSPSLHRALADVAVRHIIKVQLRQSEFRDSELVVVELAGQPQFQTEVRDAIYSGLRKRADVAPLLDEWEERGEGESRASLVGAD